MSDGGGGHALTVPGGRLDDAGGALRVGPVRGLELEPMMLDVRVHMTTSRRPRPHLPDARVPDTPLLLLRRARNTNLILCV